MGNSGGGVNWANAFPFVAFDSSPRTQGPARLVRSSFGSFWGTELSRFFRVLWVSPGDPGVPEEPLGGCRRACFPHMRAVFGSLVGDSRSVAHFVSKACSALFCSFSFLCRIVRFVAVTVSNHRETSEADDKCRLRRLALSSFFGGFAVIFRADG